jgi:hypothetical protein
MGVFDRWRRASTKRARAPAPALAASGDPPDVPSPETPSEEPSPDALDAPNEPAAAEAEASRGLSGWIEQRAKRVMRETYEAHVADIEERALRVVKSMYERSADDLEQRAVRAMRRAIEAEADRIKEAIEHGVAVKKREVRLSLLVLVASSVVYLALYWFTHLPEAP